MNSPHLPEALNEVFSSDVEKADAVSQIMEDVCPGGILPDRLTELLPEVLRIQSLERVLTPKGQIHNRAVLYHQRCKICVDWITQQVDTRLHRYGLVRIRHALTIRSSDGALRIERLLPADQPLPSLNLFDTVLPEWVKDRTLVGRASALWAKLPRPLAHLFNSLLWESGRFHRYVTGPSSIRGHHNAWNGNFRHSVEVAELARDIGQRTPLANVALLIAGGLLHDAAKADEYRYDRTRSAFRLSDRGELVGHRDTLIEWLAVARQTGRVAMPDDVYLALLHMINAVKGAPAWLGLREPRCLEAEILSMADRLSGQEDVHTRCAPESQAGFGSFHAHVGRRTYVTRKEMA